MKSIPEVRCGVTGVEVDGPAKEYGRLIPLPVVPGAQKAQRRIRFGEIGIETCGSLGGTVRRGDSGLLREQPVFREDCKAISEAGPSKRPVRIQRYGILETAEPQPQAFRRALVPVEAALQIGVVALDVGRFGCQA